MLVNHIKTAPVRLALFFLFFASLFLGCKKENNNANKLDITNQSGADVVLVNTSTGERFPISKGEVKIISSALTIANFVIEGTSGNTNTFEFEAKGDQKYIIYGYEYFLQYKISGQSTQASISFTDDSGQKVELPKVTLPYYISYKKFPGKRFSVNAENLEQTGYVTIAVITKGKVVKELSAPQRVAIAGNVDGTSMYE